jgi:hypothetical protein
MLEESKVSICQRLKTIKSECLFLDGAWLTFYFEYWDENSILGMYVGESKGGEIIALLSAAKKKSRLGVNYVSIGFNEDSDTPPTNITVEYNDFLTEAANCAPKNSFHAFFQFMKDRPGWSEVRINAVSERAASLVLKAANDLGFLYLIQNRSLTYYVDLEYIRRSVSNSYLSMLSQNTRAQIRRSMRKIETEFGRLQINFPIDIPSALVWFDELGELHTQRWNSGVSGEGFKNPKFRSYHKHFIQENFVIGRATICRVTAGEAIIGYLYLFIHNRVVYFVLSGINYNIRSDLSPGMVLHSLAIQHFIDAGLARYDFMAGTARYKKSMATNSHVLSYVSVRRKEWYFVLEHGLRYLKNKTASLFATMSVALK